MKDEGYCDTLRKYKNYDYEGVTKAGRIGNGNSTDYEGKILPAGNQEMRSGTMLPNEYAVLFCQPSNNNWESPGQERLRF
jgi:hypothetical protein